MYYWLQLQVPNDGGMGKSPGGKCDKGVGGMCVEDGRDLRDIRMYGPLHTCTCSLHVYVFCCYIVELCTPYHYGITMQLEYIVPFGVPLYVTRTYRPNGRHWASWLLM